MKTLLIPTDFSANATHAAEYAFHLAKKIKAKLFLCNALAVPMEMMTADAVSWPAEEYVFMDDASTAQLKLLKERLESKGDDASDFLPPVQYTNKVSRLTDLIQEVTDKEEVQMVVTGTHQENILNRILMRNNCQDMIDCTCYPLLLVPPSAAITPLKRIAFATDFQHPDTDLKSIYQLIALARQLRADVLITHVYDKRHFDPEYQQWAERFLTDISNKANYPNIYYRTIESASPEAGLDWLCKNGQIDALAMVHYKHNFVEKLLKGSHTQKMANHIQIPLLVLPAHT